MNARDVRQGHPMEKEMEKNAAGDGKVVPLEKVHDGGGGIVATDDAHSDADAGESAQES